jgi:hypothetical protein
MMAFRFTIVIKDYKKLEMRQIDMIFKISIVYAGSGISGSLNFPTFGILEWMIVQLCGSSELRLSKDRADNQNLEAHDTLFV